jgi:hypothetical protein
LDDVVHSLKLEVLVDIYVSDDIDADDYSWGLAGVGLHFALPFKLALFLSKLRSMNSVLYALTIIWIAALNLHLKKYAALAFSHFPSLICYYF